jgi:acetylornithine deacetylase/succinyl-diaminopimelate desuccinylase-like protein
VSEQLGKRIDAEIDGYREDLFELLRQPSISATGEGMEACAELVGGLFETYGFDSWRRIETSRYPLVYAEWTVDPSQPTVLFYGHYDVQPAGDESLWASPPFDPTVRDGAIYARGSGDNKGQFLTHLFALDALLSTTDADGPPVNVRCLIEGGEENGSVGLEEYLHGDPVELGDIDFTYVADGPMHRSGRPTIIYGNRGLLSFRLELERANRDVHSGNLGGPVPSASNDLVDVVASLWDEDGIAVEGVYDAIDIPQTHRALVDDIPVDEDAIRSNLGLDEFATDRPYYEQLLLEPAITVNGIRSGYVGEGMKTVRPCEAAANLDIRLLPNQDPEAVFELVEAHVHEREPAVDVSWLGSFPPMLSPVDTPQEAVIREALAAVWGTEPVEMPLYGGSLPAAHFRTALDVPVLVVPYANNDQNNHAPNEHLDVECFRNGIETSAQVLHRLGHTETGH